TSPTSTQYSLPRSIKKCLMWEVAVKNALTSIIIALSATLSVTAFAAEIKVISAGAVRTVIASMIDDYKKTSGDTFDFTVGPTGFRRDVIAAGKPADLMITSSPLMSELEATG